MRAQGGRMQSAGHRGDDLVVAAGDGSADLKAMLVVVVTLAAVAAAAALFVWLIGP